MTTFQNLILPFSAKFPLQVNRLQSQSFRVCTGGVLRWWLQNPDLLQILSMGQKIVHSWNEIGGWNTMEILFRNLHFTVRGKRNLVVYFTHVSDVGCLIPKLSWNLIFNLIGPLSSELHWVYLEQVSLCVRAGILCQGQTIIVLLGPLENSSNRHIILGNSYIFVFATDINMFNGRDWMSGSCWSTLWR